MSFGMRVWDSAGNMRMDVTDRTGKYVGIYTVPVIAKRSGYTLSLPGYVPGEWMFSAIVPYMLAITQQQNAIYFFNSSYYLSSVTFQIRIYKA